MYCSPGFWVACGPGTGVGFGGWTRDKFLENMYLSETKHRLFGEALGVTGNGDHGVLLYATGGVRQDGHAH